MICCMSLRGWLALATISLCATWLVFLEYLPPVQKVSIHSDLAGYHYPLLNFAYQELREGRFPAWDPVMYCGLSFAGMIQEGLFYPPNWLLFLTAPLTKGLLQKHLEALVMLHLWAGFLFCFGWLNGRVRDRLAAFAGASAFALGGMPLAQIQHMGVVCCYAWTPLALWAVERLDGSRPVRAWLALAGSSAMALLAGYPPTFLAFALCVVCWAIAAKDRRRVLPLSMLGLGFSLLLAGAQVLPGIQAGFTRYYEKSYSGGLPDGLFTALLLFLPNYHDSALPAAGVEAWGDSFYMGGVVVAGLLSLLGGLGSRRIEGGLAAPFLTLGSAAILIANPGGSVDAVVSLSPSLAAALREYNLLPCVTISACCLAAHGIAWLRSAGPAPLPAWAAAAASLAAIAWSARLLAVWTPGGSEFASGWATLLDAAVSASLAALLLLAPAAGWRARASAAALILLVVVELKVFGTSRKFSAEAGQPDKRYRALRDMRSGGHAMAGMEQSVFEQIRSARWHRVIVLDAPQPLELHHYGLSTPQGFEASLPATYRERISAYFPWQTNRTFVPDPDDRQFLDDFGVRFAVCRSGQQWDARLASLPHWRALGGGNYFYRVFEYVEAKPTYRWGGAVHRLEWLPARRSFEVASEEGGAFILLEQNLPGWTVTVDGQPAALRPYGDVFQEAEIPPGRHTVAFEYRPRDVSMGGALSLASWAVFFIAWLRSGRSRTA